MRARISICLLAGALFASCRGGSEVDLLIADYLGAKPLRSVDSTLSLEEGYRIQDAFVTGLEDTLGPVVGYKAALTNRTAQERFGIMHPVSGRLLRRMLIPAGAPVPLVRTYRPLIEADLLVRVSDAAINGAQTRAEALAALDAAIPFAEIPDILFDPALKITAPMLAAANAGARYGVCGTPIALARDRDWEALLPRIRARIVAGDGSVLAEGKGEALLGHPLDAVLRLTELLNDRGIRLRPGDLLSLGSLAPPLPLHGTTSLDFVYEGLAPSGPDTLRASFE